MWSAFINATVEISVDITNSRGQRRGQQLFVQLSHEPNWEETRESQRLRVFTTAAVPALPLPYVNFNRVQIHTYYLSKPSPSPCNYAHLVKVMSTLKEPELYKKNLLVTFKHESQLDSSVLHISLPFLNKPISFKSCVLCMCATSAPRVHNGFSVLSSRCSPGRPYFSHPPPPPPNTHRHRHPPTAPTPYPRNAIQRERAKKTYTNDDDDARAGEVGEEEEEEEQAEPRKGLVKKFVRWPIPPLPPGGRKLVKGERQ